MAERVAKLLRENPDESFFFAFGAGKTVALLVIVMCNWLIVFEFMFLLLNTDPLCRDSKISNPF